MGLLLCTLLYLQFRYFDDVYNMRREQFDEAVARSLSQAAQSLEFYETQTRLDDELGAPPSPALTAVHDTMPSPSALDFKRHASASADSLPLLGNLRVSVALRDTVERYLHSKTLLGEMLTILYKPSDKTFAERLNVKLLDSNIKQELSHNGISLPYHFRVTTSDGHEVFRCQDYSPQGEERAYRQELFPKDSRAQMGIVYLHFPEMRKYLFAGVRFILPAIIFTLIFIIAFWIAVWSILRQRHLTEIKNDFINNMTHEFKTPISTISLAAQMLGDPSVTKSDKMFKHISSVINDETKRLRFQVEKVLQISMLDKKASTFKPREVNVNTLLGDVVTTFRLKVETNGGLIETDLAAAHADVFADEMHLTNVAFNLLDNAIKYQHPDRPLHLNVKTRNKDNKLIITIADNGIGIKRDDLRKIFDRFYRVHTGNRHDVKGFGLGLAYVKSVVDNSDGTIHAESDFGQGTRFLITLPTINNDKR